MNKYFASLSLTALLLFSTQATAHFFIKLVPFITENSGQWTKTTSLLKLELQLAFLNFFALNAPQSAKAFMQCIKYLEDNSEEAIPSFKALQETMFNVVAKYVEPIEKKIAVKKEKKELSPTEEENIRKQLDEKIQELVMYMTAYYYQSLYNHIAKTNPQALMFIFDENGLIPQEKRTAMLPQSL